MWAPETTKAKIIFVAIVTAFTVVIHYGWLEPVFGHQHWIHAIHGRLCYIPIVIAASWFGVRGGVYTASAISILVLPIAMGPESDPHEVPGEIAEIVFYFAIAILIGVLVEREFRARRKHREAQSRVERSQKLSLVGQLAAGVAHEIKNPLASIKGAADILVDDDTSPSDRDEFAGILRNEIRRIDATVGEFLEFARPREAEKQRLNLTETLQASLRQIEGQVKHQGSAIQAELEENVFVNGDAAKLHQMTLNLVLNAAHASSNRGNVSVRLQSKNGNSVHVTFTDSGAGIPPEELDRVFEPFYTTKATGTGLGLTVVKDIVEDHEGEIRIASEENRGTTVTIVLPLYTE